MNNDSTCKKKQQQTVQDLQILGNKHHMHSIELALKSTKNKCFRVNIRKIMHTPVNPNFSKLWNLRGSKLHSHVSMMLVSYLDKSFLPSFCCDIGALLACTS